MDDNSERERELTFANKIDHREQKLGMTIENRYWGSRYDTILFRYIDIESIDDYSKHDLFHCKRNHFYLVLVMSLILVMWLIRISAVHSLPVP